MGQSISIVIPVYNSSNSLPELYQRLTNYLNPRFSSHEIVMVDDGSRDSSYKQMLALHRRDKRVKTISLDGNFGQQNALLCGLRYTRGEYIITMDDDLQHYPEEIGKLISAAKEGYDVVYGIASKKHNLFYRNLGSKLTDRLFNLITPKSTDIRVSSFRLIKRSLLEKIIEHEESFVYISAIILKYTDNIGNIQVEHGERKYGVSNYTFLKLLKLFLKIFIYYSGFPFLKYLRLQKPQYVIKDIQKGEPSSKS